MKLEKNAYPFNLNATLCCGQVFRWVKKNGWWYGIVKDKVFKIHQIGTELEFVNTNEDFVKNYFGLNDDFNKIVNQISKDQYIKIALEKFWGLRIIQQDPWECLISYICATYKNISAIKQMLLNLSRTFGEKVNFDGCKFYTLPEPEKLAKAEVTNLAKCNLGYRAKYVAETAKRIYKSNFDFQHLRDLPYEKAREALLNFSGVGLKVADCILLFSLGKLEAFPVDIWVKRAILKSYSKHFPVDFIRKLSRKKSVAALEYQKLNMFGRSYFGKYAGYAQEYLYYFERTQC